MSNLTKYNFHGDELAVVEQDGDLFVALKPMCTALGIDAKSQRAKLQSKAWAVGVFITSTGPDGKHYEMFCLSLDSVPMWLATIEALKVPEHVRGKLLRYQLECAHVLRDHFLGANEPPSTSTSHEVAQAQARIGDDPRAISTMRAWCRNAAFATGRTLQSIHGQLRKPWGTASVYRIPLAAFGYVVEQVQGIVVRGFERKALPKDRRQVEMWGDKS